KLLHSAELLRNRHLVNLEFSRHEAILTDRQSLKLLETGSYSYNRFFLDFMSIRERLVHRHFVNVFQITSHRHAHRNASYAQSERLEQTADVVCRGLAFGGGIRCQNHFRYCYSIIVFRFQAGQKIRKAEFIWTDVTDR